MKINRFEMPLTASPRNQWLVIILISLMLIGSLLPWLTGGSISLTFGVYDLAEWISLRLLERPMQTVLLLRAIPVLIAILIGLFGTQQRRWSVIKWLSAVMILLIAAALLPPFEFFLDNSLRSDVNYSQQFQLAGAALISGGLALSGLFRRFHVIATLIASVIMMGLATLGLLQTRVIVDGLGIMPQLGLGFILLTGSTLMLCLLTVVSEFRTAQRQT